MAKDARRLQRGPLVGGVEFSAGGVRVVTARREDGRLRLTGTGFSALPPAAIAGGLVVDRRAATAALASAAAQAEVGERASLLVAAVDGDDVRTYHGGTTFDRTAAASPIAQGEIERAVREARDEAAREARSAAADDAALRGVATVQLRDDIAGFVLDGRLLERLQGFQGRYVEVRTDLALAPLLQAGAANAVLDTLKRRSALTSGIYGLARLLAASGYGDGGILRLGADVTAYAILRGGRVLATRVFGLGRDAFAARPSTREADATVWARCVLAPLAVTGEGGDRGGIGFPSRWSVVGVPDELRALPTALANELVALRGGTADIAPLRMALATRLAADANLHPDHLVACGAAALGAELYA